MLAYPRLAGGGAAGSLNLLPSPLPAAALPALGQLSGEISIRPE